jgi:hypothetical protein
MSWRTIGWPTGARLSKLNQVVGLARLLIRQEVHCANLASLVLRLVLQRLPSDWQARYGIRPVLAETFVDRSRFTGRTFGAANWQRIGTSSGRGRLGSLPPVKTLKDIWVFPLTRQARRHLQAPAAPVLTPQPVTENLAQTDWCAHELGGLDLGDQRLDRRAQRILEARWQQPQASFYGSFAGWSPAKAAYDFIEHPKAPISLSRLLAPQCTEISICRTTMTKNDYKEQRGRAHSDTVVSAVTDPLRNAGAPAAPHFMHIRLVVRASRGPRLIIRERHTDRARHNAKHRMTPPPVVSRQWPR